MATAFAAGFVLLAAARLLLPYKAVQLQQQLKVYLAARRLRR
jgi:hypothetical protein